MSDAPIRAGLPRPVKILIWFASAALAYTLTGFLVLPAIIKSQMVKRLPLLTHRQAAVREVKLNPYTFALTVGGLSLLESNGAVFAGFDQLHVQFQALASLSARAWVFKDVTVTHPVAQITRRKDGGFNFDNLFPNSPSNAPAAPVAAIPAVVVESLRIDDATVTLDDLTPATPFHDKLAPINLQLTRFSTRTNATAPYTFSALTDGGERISASGRIGAQPPQSSGHVQLTGLALKRYAPYVADCTTAEILDGKLDAGADYQFALGAKGLEAAVSNGAAQLAGFQLKAPEAAEPVVSIPTLTVDQAEASLANKSARVRSVKSSGGSLVVRQNHDGTINLLALLKPQPAAAKPAAPDAAPWTSQVDEIAFDTYAVQIEDRKPARPVKMEAHDLAFKITGFNSALTAPIAIDSSLRLNGQGTLGIKGTATLAPLSADLTVELAGLDLPAFQPYLADKVNVEITGGQLEVRGKAHYAASPAVPMATFAGEVSVTKLAATDQVNAIDLAKFDSLAVKGIDFAFQPNRLQVQEVRLAGLDATVLIETNRQLNVLTLFPPQPAAAAAAPSGGIGFFPISLGTLALDRMSLHLLDRSIEPNCAFDVQELSGSVRDISTDPKGPATVDLNGRVSQFSPFSVTGTVDPLAKDVSLDLTVSCKNIDMAAFSAYMEKYGGYPLVKGKLLLDLHYDIARRALSATNKIILADLTLGPKNNSPDATHLPVKLGIALLKDRNGNIVLDVPLSGSLDDPKFQVVPLVWQFILENLYKAAKSPFTLLGAVVGGKGEELSHVDFSPGSAVLSAEEQAKIRKLGAALYERPALELEIAGAANPSADGDALARNRLQRQIQEARARELAAGTNAVPAVESINVEPADYARLLQALYTQSFGAKDLPPGPATLPKPALPLPAGPQPQLITTPIFAHHEPRKGGELMMQRASAPSEAEESLAPTAAPPPSKMTATSAPDAGQVAQMEQRLMAGLQVSDDDLRELMQARARAVQAALLESGKVSADRVAILAPKAIHRSGKGEARANFSLE